MVAKFQLELSEARAALLEEGQQKSRLQLEMDAKDAEIEQLQGRVAQMNSDTVSVNSGNDLEVEDGFPGKRSNMFRLKEFWIGTYLF